MLAERLGHWRDTDEVPKSHIVGAGRTAQWAELGGLDLPGFRGERLAHFPGLSLEGDGALEAER